MPTVKRLFEISFVDHDDPFYQLDNLPVYKLYCRTFEYSSEILDTGIDAIDDIETKRSTAFQDYELSGEQGSSTTYNQEIGLECGTMYATGPGMVELEDGLGQLLGENETGFTSILTEDSDAYYTFFIIQEAFNISTQDTQSDNEFLETQATAILDFTESNPFGDPTEST